MTNIAYCFADYEEKSKVVDICVKEELYDYLQRHQN